MRPEHWIYTVPLRIRSLFRRGRVERELDEELRYHVERQTEENVAAGMPADEARLAALRAIGGVEQQKEECRDARRVRWLEELAQDLGHGFRALAHHRAFSIVAVLTLGLGIGANTAVFSVVDAVFLQPLPYADADRLVVVWEDDTAHGYPRDTPAPGNYLDWKESTTVFEDMAATMSADLSLTGDGDPERISVLAVTPNFFSLLGVEPARGRGFVPDDDREGGQNAVIISDGLWRRRYGGDENVVGREILLNGERCTVVGVTPRGFQLFDTKTDLWAPLTLGPQQKANRNSHFLKVVARLRPGVTLEQARAEMRSTMERIGREFPDEAAGLGAAVIPVREQLTGDAQRPLVVLLAAVALVLLIACVNVGSLMLARAAARSREIAVRAAIGASRGRIARQLLAENVPLVLCGTGVGLLLASASLGVLRQLVPPGVRASAEVGLDVRVLAFTALVAVATTVLFSLVPALEASKIDLIDALRRSGARAGTASGRLRSALVIGEVSLAIVLLVGASLLVQTLFVLRGQYSALEAPSVLTMKTVLPKSAYDTHAKREAFFERAVERLRSVPGVVSIGYTNALPLDSKGDANSFTVEGFAPEPGAKMMANSRLVSADYLKALGVPVRAGRHFSDADGPQSQRVTIVNETLVRQYFPNQDPLGRRLKFGGPQSDAPWTTIVGVAADVRGNGVDAPVKPEMYLPYRQCEYAELFAPKAFAIRTSGDQASVGAAARVEIAAVDPNQPVSDVKTLEDILSDETSQRRLGTLLLGSFAAVALLLASIGIYGLLAQFVEHRVREIGLRLALGATPGGVSAAVVARAMKLVLVGSAAGLALSYGMTRLIASLLFGVAAADPLTLVGVPILLALVALVACYVPARRASRVDPSVALRFE
jgi:putative ABC transport system permease protein